MTGLTLHHLALGAFAMAAAAISLFFWRFWRKSRDPLFAMLGIAFALLAVERVVLAFVPPEQEGRHWIYVVRLLAFLLIIFGVWQKNRPKNTGRP